VGFNDWRHLSARIPDHENSPEHRANCLTWEDSEQRLKKEGCIDDGFQRAIAKEREKWRHILRVIIDAILFCAKYNLAVRGTNEVIGKRDCGNFLSTIELISRYDRTLREHVENYKKAVTLFFSSYSKLNYKPRRKKNQEINYS
jgi:hypothetical protein